MSWAFPMLVTSYEPDCSILIAQQRHRFGDVWFTRCIQERNHGDDALLCIPQQAVYTGL